MPILYGSTAIKYYDNDIIANDVDLIDTKDDPLYDVGVVSQELYDEMLSVLELNEKSIPSLNNLRTIYLATCCRLRTLRTRADSIRMWQKYLKFYHKLMKGEMMHRHESPVFNTFLKHTLAISKCRDAYSMTDIENVEFFEDRVPRIIKHDSLHDIIAKKLRGPEAVELFTEFKTEGEKAALDDEKLWNGIQSDLKTVRQMIIEELIVLIIERCYLINIRSRLRELNDESHFEDSYNMIFSHFTTNLCGDGDSLLRRYVIWDSEAFFTEDVKQLIYKTASEISSKLGDEHESTEYIPLDIKYLEQLTITRMYALTDSEMQKSPDTSLFAGEALEALSLALAIYPKVIGNDDTFYNPFTGDLFNYKEVIGNYRFIYEYPVLNLKTKRVTHKISRDIAFDFHLDQEEVKERIRESYEDENTPNPYTEEYYYGSHCAYFSAEDYKLSLNVSVTALDKQLPTLIQTLVKTILQSPNEFNTDLTTVEDKFDDISLTSSWNGDLGKDLDKLVEVSYDLARANSIDSLDSLVMETVRERMETRIRDKLYASKIEDFFELHARLHRMNIYPEMISFCDKKISDHISDEDGSSKFGLGLVYFTIMHTPVNGFFIKNCVDDPIIPETPEEWYEMKNQIDLFFAILLVSRK